MKYRLILLSVLFFSALFASAQTAQDQDARAQFVGLQSGQKIYAKRVQLKSPLLKSNYFLLDDTLRYPVSAVKYYQNENGYFLKVSDMYSGREDFAERLVSGRISKFTLTRTTYNDYGMPGYGRYGGFGGYGGYGNYGAPSRRNIYLFTKDDGQLQLYNYENLREAVGDNPGSLELLMKYRKDRYVDTGISIAGAALLAIGVSQSFKADPSTGTGSFQASKLLYAGAVVISIPWIKGLFQKDKLAQAIELYNFQKKE